jgi:pimeloyl-ACP methyl ester carboxylesterase
VTSAGLEVGVEPFRVAVDDAVLDDLRDRLRHTRWPQQVDDAGWDYGANGEYVRDVCRTWAETYEWRDAEQRLNRWPQFTTVIDGVRIHFLHVVSPVAGARPLILMHGWPSSVLEFLDVIEPLIDPESAGGRAADAFSVVIPSLPGYGWSEAPRERGWHDGRVGRAFLELMSRLGYDEFYTQGGDWGAMISSEFTRLAPERIRGFHTSFLVTAGYRPEDEPLTPQERAVEDARVAYNAHEKAYIALQSTKPDSLGFGLADSPAAQAAWILEKLNRWTDNRGDLEAAVSRTAILDLLTTYWVTNTGAPSARLYYETAAAGRMALLPRVETPTAIADFPAELNRVARRAAERQYNIVRWTEMKRGGHFPAWEQPAAFVRDVRASFGPAKTA